MKGISGNAVATDQLKQLQTSYVGKLPREIEHICSLWKKILYVKWDSKSFALFHRLVHNLSGSAGTYGLHEVSEVSARLDQQLAAIEDVCKAPSEHERSQIGAQLKRLGEMVAEPQALEVLETGVDLTPSPSESLVHRPRVLILEDDPDFAAMIKLYLSHNGYETTIVSNLPELHRAIEADPPDVLLADVMLRDKANGGIDAVGELRASGRSEIKVLFMSARGDLEARLAAIRVGCNGYFVKPVEMAEVAKTIDNIIDATEARYRVLVLDDDPDTAAYHAEVLSLAGLETCKLTSPMQMLETLYEFRPDLVLMDLYMPDCSGGELAQIIRQESRFIGLPIIFVSAEQDLKKQNAALTQGGDAFLVKPIANGQLVEAVNNRVKHARQLRRRLQYLDPQDPQTGLINQRAMLAHLDKSIDELSGAGTAAVLFFIDIDNYRNLRNEIGFSAAELLIADIANLIRTEIGTFERIARMANAGFVALLPAISEITAKSVSERLRRMIASHMFNVGQHSLSQTITIGIAPLNDSYRTGDQWLSGAALACDIARRSGGNSSYLHQPESDRKIEDEQNAACADLLQTALDTDALYCVYQPIAGLHGDCREKYDVLLRMNDNEGNEVLPARFLPVAEKQGMLGKIDRWVTRNAIEILAARCAENKRTVFFVKLSAPTLSDEHFADWVGEQLIETGLPAPALVFEYEERTVMAKMDKAAQLGEQLRRLGCGVALAKFRGKPESLRLLSELTIDFIKVDGSLMQDLTASIANQDGIRAILDSANDKGIGVIASYVEDAASLQILWECGVQFIQGNFLQAPSDDMNFMFAEHLS